MSKSHELTDQQEVQLVLGFCPYCSSTTERVRLSKAQAAFVGEVEAVEYQEDLKGASGRLHYNNTEVSVCPVCEETFPVPNPTTV